MPRPSPSPSPCPQLLWQLVAHDRPFRGFSVRTFESRVARGAERAPLSRRMILPSHLPSHLPSYPPLMACGRPRHSGLPSQPLIHTFLVGRRRAPAALTPVTPEPAPAAARLLAARARGATQLLGGGASSAPPFTSTPRRAPYSRPIAPCLARPIPSHPIASHPVASHPIPSHRIPSHRIPSRRVPSRRVPSHPDRRIASRLVSSAQVRRLEGIMREELNEHSSPRTTHMATHIHRPSSAEVGAEHSQQQVQVMVEMKGTRET
jgi:hypothetical protein